MKIAVYHNQHAGGAARVIEAWLAHQGKHHHLELFTPDTADTGFIDLEQYVAKVYRISIPGSETPRGRYERVLAVPKYGREIAANIDAGGFDVVFANLSYVTQAPEILPYLKTPSLYYCPETLRAVYDRSPFPEPRTIKGLAKKVFFAPYDRRRVRLDKRAIRAANHVFTHSNFTSSVLRSTYGVEAEVIYLGVDTELFKPLELPREPYVLSVGAMHPLKGHQFVIEALATLPKHERPKLLAVGSRGDFGRQLVAYAAEQTVELELKQSITTDSLIELYNRATVMAAAQYNEPFGLITLEAMACKTPVVAVREGGLAETVTDGATGLLTRRDPAEFGEAIAKVFRDQLLATTLGENGRADTLERWQWSKTAQRINELLQQTART